MTLKLLVQVLVKQPQFTITVILLQTHVQKALLEVIQSNRIVKLLVSMLQQSTNVQELHALRMLTELMIQCLLVLLPVTTQEAVPKKVQLHAQVQLE